jgi:hypothetical protein
VKVDTRGLQRKLDRAGGRLARETAGRYGVVDENSRAYADRGAVVYRRRLAYWKRRELSRV